MMKLIGKGDVTNCGAYRGVKLLEQVIKTVKRVMESYGKSRLDVK